MIIHKYARNYQKELRKVNELRQRQASGIINNSTYIIMKNIQKLSKRTKKS